MLRTSRDVVAWFTEGCLLLRCLTTTAAALVCVASFACAPRVQLDLEAFGDAATAIIVFGEDGDSTPAAAIVVDLAGASAVNAQRIADFDDKRVVALLFDETLAELQLEPGLLQLSAPTDVNVRNLSDLLDDSREGLVVGGRLSAWPPMQGELPTFARLPVGLPDWGECAALGGCPVSGDTSCASFFDGDALPTHCVVPCPAATPPEPPRPPSLTPCRAGWGERVGADGLTTCAPTNEPGQRCPEGLFRFFGASECGPVVADGCPAGDWPPDPGSGPTTYVRSGAAMDAPGTRASPVGSIQVAIERSAGEARTIVISAGAYAEDVRLNRANLTLIGACSARTVIASDAGTALMVTRENSAVRDLTLNGGRTALRVVGPGEAPAAAGALTAQNLKVVGGAVSAVEIVGGATATLSDTVVEGRSGVGVRVEDAELVLGRVAIDRAMGVGLECDGGQVDARELVVQGTQASTDGLIRGVDVRGGCRLQGAGLRVLHERGEGIHVEGDASSRDPNRSSEVALEDIVMVGPGLDDGAGLPAEAEGHAGLHIGPAAQAQLLGAWLEGATLSGVLVESSTLSGNLDDQPARASLLLEDVVVRGVRPRGSGLNAAVKLLGGVDVTIRRAAFEDNPGVEIMQDGTNSVAGSPEAISNLELEDALIRPSAAPAGGLGEIVLGRKARIVARRLYVSHATGAAILAVHGSRSTGQLIELEDIDIVSPIAGGILVRTDDAVTMQRIRITGATGTGFDLAQEAHVARGQVKLSDLQVVDTQPHASGAMAGMRIANTADARLSRFDVQGASARGFVFEAVLSSTRPLRQCDGAIRDHPTGLFIENTPDFDRRWLTERVRFSNTPTAISP